MAKDKDATQVGRGAIHDSFYPSPHKALPVAKLRAQKGKVAPHGREPLGTTERLEKGVRVSKEGKGPEASKTIRSNQAEAQELGKKMLADKAKKK